jgi:hypothetical protein
VLPVDVCEPNFRDKCTLLLLSVRRLTVGRNSFTSSVVFHSGSNVLFECENETHGAVVRGYKKSRTLYESKCDALLRDGNAEDLHFFHLIDTVHSKRVSFCVYYVKFWKASHIAARWLLLPVRFSLNISQLS